MKALVFEELNRVKLKDVAKPVLVNETDVIVKVKLTTICGSDVHFMQGHVPITPGHTLGHEYVGEIEQVGSAVKDFKPGDRVVGASVLFCGQCERCLAGHIYRCLNGGVFGAGPEYGGLNGSHSEYMRIPHADASLLHIPDELSDEQALFVGDILSTGYFATEKGSVIPGDTVVVFGAGPVGLCAVITAKLFSPKQIILVGRKDEFRLEMGKKLGATHTILSSKEDVLETIHKLTGGEGADVAIDAAGSETTLHQASCCLGIGGRLSIAGLPGPTASLPMFELFSKNVRIEMGLVDLHHMKRLLKLIQSGQVDLSPLITHRMKLDQMEEAMELFASRKENVIKVAITP
ncbi:MAG: alcohol dehydrogenase catalytic domain-containing protein [Firmicutes bacterium]|nr:alcohol dehydrogenase catalytic domain-containing protein [Bacillota bacterium]